MHRLSTQSSLSQYHIYKIQSYMFPRKYYKHLMCRTCKYRQCKYPMFHCKLRP